MVAVIVTLYVPSAVGVPSISPKSLTGGVPAFKPGGNRSQCVVGLLVAVIGIGKGQPPSGGGRSGLVIHRRRADR